MSEQQQVEIIPHDKWIVHSVDNQSTVLAFSTPEGAKGFMLNNNELSSYAAVVINAAADAAQRLTPALGPAELRTVPIPAAQMSLNPDPMDSSSGLLSIQTGNLILTFRVDLSMLGETLSRLSPNTSGVARKPS